MARGDAVRAVHPALFDSGWSKVSGSAGGGFGKRAQMVRAARGHSPAIFKPIRQGGCHTGAQLRSQLTYLTSKSSFILDSRVTHDGKARLSPGEIERVARRFENQWNERHSPKLGHTSHLLMAFPIGTRTSEVREITREICERFFQGDGAHFDYIAAIHEDRAHPHAHVVLNRRSRDGEMFFLGKGHHFNYDAFREAMVEAAARHGLRLEATRRLDRGVMTRQADVGEVQKAREEGRAPIERQRTGPDLERALAEVARNATIYRGLAAEATRSNFHDVADALSRAAAMLGQGGQIEADGVLYMRDDETGFDELLDQFSQNIRKIEKLVEHAPAAERPVIERKLAEVLQEVSHLNPLGDRSDTLHEPASRDGIYAAPNLVEMHRDQLADPLLRARVVEAVQGTGIDSDAVLARLREGANNAALEQQWLAQDLRAIAKEQKLDLRDGAQRTEAMDRLEAVHGKLGDVLTDARILRAVEDVERERPEGEDMDRRSERDIEPEILDASDRREFQALVRQFERTDFSYPYSDDSRAYRDGEKAVANASEAFDRFANRSPQHAELASIAWEKATDVIPLPRAGVSAGARTLHSGDMEVALRDPSKHQSVDANAPELSAALRQAAVGKVDLGSEGAERRFVEQIDAQLDPAEIDQLLRGDAEVLKRLTTEPPAQLELARSYLAANKVHARDPAMDRVLDRMVEERNREAPKHGQTDGEKGVTHG